MKALGTGHSQGVTWRSIEVVRRHGPPQLEFHGAAQARLAALHGTLRAPDDHALARRWRSRRCCCSVADNRLDGPVSQAPAFVHARPLLPRVSRRADAARAPSHSSCHGLARRRPAGVRACALAATSSESSRPRPRGSARPAHRPEAPAMVVKIRTERQGQPAREAGRRRTALRRGRARRPEADRLRASGSGGTAAAATSRSRRASTRSTASAGASRCSGRSSTRRRRTRLRELILQAYAEHEEAGGGRRS